MTTHCGVKFRLATLAHPRIACLFLAHVEFPSFRIDRQTMTSKNEKLSILDKVGYAFGDGASNLIWMSFIYFQSKFYTDVFFYTPDAAAGTLPAGEAGGAAAADARLRYGLRPVHGHDGRPDPYALGQVPSLSALVRRALRHHQHADLHHARFQPQRQADLRLHHALL